MKLSRYENFLVVLVLTLILAGSVWGDGFSEKGPVIFTDYGSYLGEYQTAGALKFYDNTEELLRLAQFERALMRYRFLKGQIRGKVDYRGLINMVDLRLQFLKRQLHLRDVEIAAIPPRKARIPRIKPPAAKPPPKKDAAAKPKPPGAANKLKPKATVIPAVTGQTPTVVVIPSRPGKAAAAPVTAAQNPREVVTTTPKTQDEKAEEAKAKEEAKPAPPLTFWQRLKGRLHWRKKSE
jgi:hypothetical protein